MVKSPQLVGHVLSSSGEYRSDIIEVTLLKDVAVYQGEYLYVIGPNENRVYVQVDFNPLRRPTASYDEKLVRDGVIRIDEERIIGKAVCRQIGYVNEKGEIEPLLLPIPPFTKVYRPTPQELSEFITPTGPSITVGKIYPAGITLTLDLRMLLRQGCLITGGVGTGKSTLLLTIIMKMLKETGKQRVHLLLIDWDGEFNVESLKQAAEEKGGYLQLNSKIRISKRQRPLSPDEYYRKFCNLAGITRQNKEGKALYAVLNNLKESGEQAIEWSEKAFREKILTKIVDEECREKLMNHARIVFSGTDRSGGVNIIEAVMRNALVHLNFSDADNWDEIINITADILEECYLEARSNPYFGVAVFIDEVHNFAPQNYSEGAASPTAYMRIGPLMRLLATTGPRNGIPLFVATQRLSEVDKVVSTQMGQNIFAFRVEDIDLD